MNSKTNIMKNTVEILAANRPKTIPLALSESGVVLAGMPIKQDGSAAPDGKDAIGILLYDVDCKHNPNATLVVRGVIDWAKVKAYNPDVTVDTKDISEILPNITFREVVYGSGGGEGEPSARLTSLDIGGLTLVPVFDPDVDNYTSETENDSDTITAIAEDENAQISINLNEGTSIENGGSAKWNDGSNTLTIHVTNGKSTMMYLVNITKKERSARVNNIKIGSLSLAPNFSTETTDYAVSTNNASDIIVVDTESKNAQVTITNAGTSVENRNNATWTDGLQWVNIKVTNGDLTSQYKILVAKNAVLPKASQWISIVYGKGMFVAVSRNKDIAYSEDGKKWAAVSSFSGNNYWYQVIFGNDMFVTISSDSGIAYSTDGKTWTGANLPSGMQGNSIAFGAGKFVVLTQDTELTFAYSTNGKTWTKGTMGGRISGSIASTRIVYGGGKFVAIICEVDYMTSSYKTHVYYSENGTSWQKSSASINVAGESSTLCYGNNKFVGTVDDTTIYSDNGIDWKTTRGILSYTSTIIYAENKFVAGDGSISYYSLDGINWTRGQFDSQASPFGNIAYGNDYFVAVCGGYNSNNTAAYSVNGIDWVVCK